MPWRKSSASRRRLFAFQLPRLFIPAGLALNPQLGLFVVLCRQDLGENVLHGAIGRVVELFLAHDLWHANLYLGFAARRRGSVFARDNLGSGRWSLTVRRNERDG